MLIPFFAFFGKRWLDIVKIDVEYDDWVFSVDKQCVYCLNVSLFDLMTF